MSGKKTGSRKIFHFVFYGFAGFLFLYSAYLFLSNIDQLFVTGAADKRAKLPPYGVRTGRF